MSAEPRRDMRASGAAVWSEPPKPSAPRLPSSAHPRLLDQVRDALRVRHYAIRTEEAYVDWIRRFIYFNGKRHPARMGKREVTAFLTHLQGRNWLAASILYGVDRGQRMTHPIAV